MFKYKRCLVFHLDHKLIDSSPASKCSTERGEIFHSNASSSWKDLGYYALGLDPELNVGDYGRYGLDSIALSDTISTPSQIVSIVNSTDYWLGFLGLGIKPTNFTSTQKPTFLASMVENQSLIPSHSYGYTAGAHYRLKSVPASLTLGGYDANRLVTNDVNFDLDPDQKPVVALNSVTVSANPINGSKIVTGWSADKFQLGAPEPDEFYTIDSSTPYLWLPESMCDKFAQALGLHYDDGLELFTFGKNATQHQRLLDSNLTFTFELTNLPGSDNKVELSLPYDAFDLQLSYPFPGLNATPSSSPINYFPLRKAGNSSQYTIGRVFLQETYLMVDYERNNFSISQAAFDVNALNNIKLVDIIGPDNSSLAGPETPKIRHGLNARDIGLVVGALIGGLAIALFVSIYCLKRMRAPLKEHLDEKTLQRQKFRLRWFKLCAKALHLPILDSAFEVTGSTAQPKEISADGEIGELGAQDEKELEASSSGSSVGGICRQQAPVPAIGHDITVPVELETNTRGIFEEHGRSPTLPPPYSPDCTGRDYVSCGNNTSISDISSDSKGASSRGSSAHPSPAFVSPMTPRFPRTVRYTLVDLDQVKRNDGLRFSREGSRSSATSSQDRTHRETSNDSPQQSPRRFSWEDTA